MRSLLLDAIDPRILVVEVTQTDINQLEGSPVIDSTLVKAIAIDMHRAQPRGEGRKALIDRFQHNSKLLTVCAFNQSNQNYAALLEE